MSHVITFIMWSWLACIVLFILAISINLIRGFKKGQGCQLNDRCETCQYRLNCK